MNVKKLFFTSKPSYKLIYNGVNSLDTAELLAVLFGKGIKNESCLEISNRLLTSYGLNRLAEMPYHALEKETDHVKALRLIACFELARRYGQASKKGFDKQITCAEDVFNRFHDRMKDLKQEHCYALYLDSKNRVLKEQLISVGTLNASIVHPREVFKYALLESANSIILVHNHPSGDPKPSRDDKLITEKLKETGKMTGINITDHIIIGKEHYYSYEADMKHSV